MKALWDMTNDFRVKGSLIGKVGAVFTSAPLFMEDKKLLPFQ